MSKLQIALSSPAFWTGAAIFVYAGLQAIAPQLGGTLGQVVQGILLLLTLYLHPKEVQTAGSIGFAGRK